MADRSVRDLLVECLRMLGVERVVGRPLPGLGHLAVDDADLARLVADADGRLGPGPGAAWLPGDVLRLSSQPGVAVSPWPIDDAGRLPAALGTWTVGEVHAVSEYHLDLDLDAPVPDELEPVTLDTPASLYTLSPSLAELATVVLAGPGVVRQGQVDALQRFAAEAGVGVVNTWGAKGVFRWDSPYHLGTGGLQARDFELAGLLDAELVIAVGLDEDEAPRHRWMGGGSQVLDVDPLSLAALAYHWPPPERVPERPRLYTELAAALADHYTSEAVPLLPARAAADLSEVLPPGGLVAADPGPAGLWIARAFPTTEPGSVVVPATVAPGIAAALALLAGLDQRPALAVTTGPVDEPTRAVLEVAEAFGVPLVLEVWGADGPELTPAEHRARVVAALAEPGVHEVPVPVDLAQTRVLVEVAGPVVAWGAGEDG